MILVPSMTTLPRFSKLTVILPAMFDWTCPLPHPFSSGWDTIVPGVKTALKSLILTPLLVGVSP